MLPRLKHTTADMTLCRPIIVHEMSSQVEAERSPDRRLKFQPPHPPHWTLVCISSKRYGVRADALCLDLHRLWRS